MLPIFVIVGKIYSSCSMQECKCLSEVLSALLHYATMTTRWRRWIVFTYSKHNPGPAVCVNTLSKLNHLFFIFGQISSHLIFKGFWNKFLQMERISRGYSQYTICYYWTDLNWECLTMVFIVHMQSRSIVNFTE